MSNLVFPDLPGLQINVTRTPIYKTAIQEASSGKELRTARWSFPRYRYELNFEALRSTAALPELQTLFGFLGRHLGSFDSFLFTDPEDSTVAAMPFGVGTGALLQFQLQRSLVPSALLPAAASRSYWPASGDGYEPVFELNGAPQIYRTDWQGTQLLSASARTNLCKQSETLAASPWALGSVTVASDAIASPRGGTTAESLTKAAAAYQFISQAISTPTVAGQDYCGSLHVKAGTLGHASLCIADSAYSGWDARVIFDLAAKTKAVNSALGYLDSGIVDLGDGWLRLWLAARATSTAARFNIYPGILNQSIAGSIYGWGAQFENSPIPTGYIGPTLASPVPVTDYTLNSSGLVTLGEVPAAGAILSWAGSFYRRVRLASDEQEAERIVQQIWESKSLELISVK